MKRATVTICLTTLSFMTFATEMTTRESLVASALDDYGMVAGAWFINKKCNFVSGDNSQAFEENVATITVALGQDLGGPAMLFAVQKGAKNTVEKEPYSECKEKAKEVFDYGYAHSKNWSDQIKKFQTGKKG